MYAEMTEIVMPGDANHLGTCFGGKIMSWIDMVAAIAAQRLVGTVVTASVDSIQFKRPIQVGNLVSLKASVNRVWNTSMEVGVSVLVQSRTRKVEKNGTDCYTSYSILTESLQACKAYLTFVAVDDKGKCRDISDYWPGLSHHDYGSNRERRWEEAEERRKIRLANRKEGH